MIPNQKKRSFKDLFCKEIVLLQDINIMEWRKGRKTVTSYFGRCLLQNSINYIHHSTFVNCKSFRNQLFSISTMCVDESKRKPYVKKNLSSGVGEKWLKCLINWPFINWVNTVTQRWKIKILKATSENEK